MTIISRFTPSLRGGGVCNFYYFDPAKASNLTLNDPFTGELTLLFSTFNGVTGLPSEFADATVTNAPAGAKADPALYDDTGQQVSRTVSALTDVIGPTFDGVLWAYALDGVWYYINQGVFVPFILNDQFTLNNNFNLWG